MSVNGTADAAVARYIAEATRGGRRAPAQEEPTAEVSAKPKGSTDYLTRATKLVGDRVPTEVIGAYLAILALAAEASVTARWALFWVFLLLTPFVTWLSFAVKLKNQHEDIPSHPRGWPWWYMIAGLISFAAWAVALPGSVINSTEWYSPWIGAAAVIGAAFVVGTVGQLFESSEATSATA